MKPKMFKLRMIKPKMNGPGILKFFAVVFMLLFITSHLPCRAGASGAAAAAGAGGFELEENSPASFDPDPGQLEIFSWWTAPGEEQGLALLMESFQEEHTEMEVVNAAVEGGAGVNAKDVLKMRLLRGSPPDAFQVHAGAELKETFVAGDYLHPLTSLWEEQGWQDLYPPELTEMVRQDGEYYALPVTVHRANRIWYDRRLLEKYDLSPPASPEELVELLNELDERGEPPLALGSRNLWPTTHIFEVLLAAVASPADYRSLVAGERSWQSPEVERTLEYLQEILPHINEDHAGLSWHEACELVREEEAALTVMGTWARGYFTAHGLEEGEDYGRAALQNQKTGEPVFQLVVDTFAMPAEAGNQGYTRSWLEFTARPDIQRQFTEILGAVPPRSDIPEEELTSAIAAELRELRRRESVPSIVHGAAVREVFVSALNEKLNVFLYENDIDETLEELENIAEIYLR